MTDILARKNHREGRGLSRGERQKSETNTGKMPNSLVIPTVYRPNWLFHPLNQAAEKGPLFSLQPRSAAQKGFRSLL